MKQQKINSLRFIRITRILLWFMLVLLFCIINIGTIQAQSLDSLKLLLDTSISDENRVKINLKLADKYLSEWTNPDQALPFIEQAMQIAFDLDTPSDLALAHALLGKAQDHLLNSDEACNILKESIKLADLSSDPNVITYSKLLFCEKCEYNSKESVAKIERLIDENRSNLFITNLYHAKLVLGLLKAEHSDFEGAATDYFEALKLLNELERNQSSDELSIFEFDKQEIEFQKNRGFQLIGELYSSVGACDEAIGYLLSIKNQDESTHEPWLNLSLAYAYANCQAYVEAMVYSESAIGLFEKSGSLLGLHYALMDLGNIYLDLDDVRAAQTKFQQAYDISTNSSFYKATSLLGLAHVKTIRSEINEAIIDFETADTLYLNVNDEYGSLIAQNGLAELMIDAKLFDLAEAKINKSITRLKSINSFRNLAISHKLLADIALANRDESKVEQYCTAYLNYGEKSQDVKIIKRAHADISLFYEQLGGYKKSIYHQRMYEQLHQKASSEAAMSKLKEQQVRQRVKEYLDEKNIAQQKVDDVSRLNLVYICVSIALLTLLVIGLYLFRQLSRSRQLIQAQNLALESHNQTKNKFFSIIAHDLKNPFIALQNVNHQIEYFVEKKDEKNLKKMSDLVSLTSKRALGLLDNLLNWALAESNMIQSNPQTLNVYEMVDQILELYAFSAQRNGIKLLNQININQQIIVDKNALHTILRNLVNNAIKFSHRGDNVVVNDAASHEEYSLAVTDTGIGMSESQKSQLFILKNHSSENENRKAGTGLGLVLVKELVDLIGAKIQVETKLNKGTRITIKIPIEEN